MAKYVLPDLPYDFGALEPHISGRIMELHHDKHHGGYVTNANTTLEKLEEARSKEDFGGVPHLERALSFNVSGHILHSIFWQNLGPKRGGPPSGALQTQINQDFGSFEKFKKQLNAASSTIMGSGWGALVWEPLAQKLLTVQIYDHQSNITQSGIPILVMDAWEHAWYLQYENRKVDFFEAVWNLWNWEDVAARLEAAKSLNAHLAKAVG